jgi:alpha-beta hydrolase superfamily lysophospholipase
VIYPTNGVRSSGVITPSIVFEKRGAKNDSPPESQTNCFALNLNPYHPATARGRRRKRVLFASQTPTTATLESETFKVTQENKPTISLRHWWKAGQKEVAQALKGPVFLLVPGLGGKSEWGTPLVSRLIDDHPIVYGMDTLALGDNPAEKGHLADRKDFTRELQTSIDYLTQKHEGPVYLAGISLGALVVTHLMADGPKNVGGVVLVAPAFRPASNSFKPWFYGKVLMRYLLESVRLMKPTPVKMPYKDDSEADEAHHLPEEAKQQISSLTASSYYQLMKFTYFESFQKAKKLLAPIFMIIPGQDTVCSPDAMQKGFNLMPSKDKSLFIFPEAHHNIIFEKYLVPMTDKINQWLKQRRPSTNG